MNQIEQIANMAEQTLKAQEKLARARMREQSRATPGVDGTSDFSTATIDGVRYSSADIQKDPALRARYAYLAGDPKGLTLKALKKNLATATDQRDIDELTQTIGIMEGGLKTLEDKGGDRLAPGDITAKPFVRPSTPSPLAPVAPAASTYKIASGDTLSAIAQKNGTTVAALMAANPSIKDPNKIYAGASLNIPGQQAPTAPGGTEQDKSRQPGESIADYVDRLSGTSQDNGAVGTSSALRTEQKIEDLKDSLGIGNAPKLLDTFTSDDANRLRTAQTERTGLEDEMASILDEKLALDEEFKKFESQQTGMPEAGRIGAISEEQRNLQFRLDALNRRELVAETKLNNRNSTIRELMGLQRQEYTDAVAQYNTQFTQALQMYGVLDAEEDEVKADAKANLEVLGNSIGVNIKAGNLLLSGISGSQRAKIEELEMQAGLPIGSTMAVLSALKPDEEKIWSGVDSKTGVFRYITRDTDGNLNMQTLAGVTTGSNSDGSSPTIAVPAFDVFVDEFMTTEQGLALAQKHGGNNVTLYKDLQAIYEEAKQKVAPATSGVAFTPTEKKKLEQAGLLNASRQAQLDYLYGKEDEAGMSDEEFLEALRTGDLSKITQ